MANVHALNNNPPAPANGLADLKTLQKLQAAQGRIVARKDQNNAFAGFTYRNIEHMLREIKAALNEDEFLHITDTIKHIDGRFYVESKASFITETGIVSSTGLAREIESRKGNDPAQITGACSSYARKYAVCALFLIDDGKAINDGSYDPDERNNYDISQQAQTQACKPNAQTQIPSQAPQKIRSNTRLTEHSSIYDVFESNGLNYKSISDWMNNPIYIDFAYVCFTGAYKGKQPNDKTIRSKEQFESYCIEHKLHAPTKAALYQVFIAKSQGKKFNKGDALKLKNLLSSL